MTQTKTETLKFQNTQILKYFKRITWNRDQQKIERIQDPPTYTKENIQVVTFHTGTGSSGHYWTMKKTDQGYFIISDDSVKKIEEQQFYTALSKHKKDMYMLIVTPSPSTL